MIGFPKYLNSKQDYINCLNDYPQEAKAELENLLKTRFSFFNVAVLENSDDGITDDTHRVSISGTDKIQQELREDENARVFQLGFTVQEVEELINA